MILEVLFKVRKKENTIHKGNFPQVPLQTKPDVLITLNTFTQHSHGLRPHLYLNMRIHPYLACLPGLKGSLQPSKPKCFPDGWNMSYLPHLYSSSCQQ